MAESNFRKIAVISKSSTRNYIMACTFLTLTWLGSVACDVKTEFNSPDHSPVATPREKSSSESASSPEGWLSQQPESRPSGRKTNTTNVPEQVPEAVVVAIPITSEPGTFYVSKPAEERLGPGSRFASTNTIFRQQKVEVFEFSAGWARVSDYYDGSVEGKAGRIARWVEASHLVKDRPADLPQPKFRANKKVDGLPEIGNSGASKRDVEILNAAADYFLEIGKARKIEYGDKSGSRKGYFYLNFGGSQNHFFQPTDIPDLERRIAGLYIVEAEAPAE